FVFRDLPPRKVLQVLSIGSWTTLEVGQRLTEQGKLSETVSLIVRGKVRVTRDGRVLGDLIAGDFVGSALTLSGIPAEVDAVTVEPGRAMRWEVGALERYLTANQRIARPGSTVTASTSAGIDRKSTRLNSSP